MQVMPEVTLKLVTSWQVGHHVTSLVIDQEKMTVWVGQMKSGEGALMYSLRGTLTTGALLATIRDRMRIRKMDVTLDTKRHLMVAVGDRSLQLFNEAGQQVCKLQNADLRGMECVAYQPGEDRYVVGQWSSRHFLFVTPEDGVPQRKVPAEECRLTETGDRNVHLAASKLSDPSLLATLDYERGEVKLYDGEGNLETTYTGDESAGKLDRPNGVCFDHQNRLLVSDTANHRVVRINPAEVDEKNLFDVILDTSSLGLGHPRMIDVTKDGLVVIAMFTFVNGPFNIAVFNGYN